MMINQCGSSFTDELKRIQELDQRDGYQDEPLAKLITQLSECHDCDDYLTVIEVFGKSTDPKVIERVAYSRYQ